MSDKKPRACPFCGGGSYKTLFVKEDFKYGRCSSCGQIYIPEVLMDNIHFEEEFYSDAELLEPEKLRDDSVRGGRMLRLMRAIRELYGERKDLRILDVGCGKGWHLAFLKNKGYAHVHGVEVNAKVAQAARARGLSIDTGFLSRQRYSDGQFDVVYLDQVVEHLEDPLDVLRECCRILRPNGLLWVSVPNVDAWHIRLWLKEKHRHFDGRAHLNYYDCATLARTVNEAGFKTKRVLTVIEEATVQRIKGVLLNPEDFDIRAIRFSKHQSAPVSGKAVQKKAGAGAGLKKMAAVLASPLNALLIGLTRASNAGAYIELTAVKDAQ